MVTAHGVCAVSLLLCIAYAAIWCADDTLHLIADQKVRQRYPQRYRALGRLMVLLPIMAFALSLVTNDRHAVFFAETAAIWAFALYWWTKSVELHGVRERLFTPPSASPLPAPVAL